MRGPGAIPVPVRGVTPLLVLALLVMVLQPFAVDLQYERDAFASGEFWRLLTGHLVHVNARHLFSNLAALVMLMLAFGRLYSAAEWLFLSLGCGILISCGLYGWLDNLVWYRGLSGLLHALFAAALLAGACRDRPVYWLGLALLIGKLWLDFSGVYRALNFAVVAEAHLLGCVSGMGLALMLRLWAMSRRPALVAMIAAVFIALAEESVAASTIGDVLVASIPFETELRVRSATYTPSGKVLVSYAASDNTPRDVINLAVMDDNGENFSPFFSQTVVDRPRSNGIRYMVFADNRRIFLGDYIIECTPDIDHCVDAKLLPVEYPAQIAGGEYISHRWSEIIVAPDNQHVAWTTLLSDYSALAFTGALEKGDSVYRIVRPRMIGTVEPFLADPNSPDRVIPNLIRGGEVKQFVHGGSAISLVGMKEGNTPDSVVQYLTSGELEQITHTPGYTETTIFSPDEKLGVTMSTRFSPATDLAILGLLPRPYPVSLDMGLSLFHYMHSVTGVRTARAGNVGPVLIDIAESKRDTNYRGINLNTDEDWVFISPLSWHPGGRKAMWIEGRRGTRERRIQLLYLPDYTPRAAVAATTTPDDIPYALTDLSLLDAVIRRKGNVDVRVDGKHSGYIHYRRTSAGITSGLIEKSYVNFSDDGERFYTGTEKMLSAPGSDSVYTAEVQMFGKGGGSPRGAMDLKLTFGPLRGQLPAEIIFVAVESGKPQSYGYSEYNGTRLSVDTLIP